MAIKLWVANTTKQIWTFTYRLGGMGQHFAKRIPAGQQICLDHLSQPEIDQVVKQNAVYGMRSAKEVSGRRGYAGLVYTTGDAPVNIDQMLESYDINDTVRTAEADQRRMTTANAMSDKIAENLHRATGIEKDKLRPARLEMEVIEETDGKPTVSAGVEVISDMAKNRPRRANA